MTAPLLPWELPSPRSVASGVAAGLARRIVEGELAAGTVLTEVAVASEAGVSRTPVREAFLELEGWGLIRLLPKKGALVTTVSAAERRDLLDVRATWEIRAVEQVAERPAVREALVAEAGALVDRQSDALAHDDLLEFAATDLRFHVTVIRAGGNAVIADLLGRLSPRFARLTYAAVADGLVSARSFRDDHDALVERIAAGDAAGFASAVRAHIRSGHFPNQR
ncbi:GntR family transcriptional regulator [Microbacterium excoecariae]|uniref:GntR family transcriptional regulator n=1 Tax=Microbacterium excoecariae TaxID=2715210 RepID=UPI00140A7EF5|nr:GntR family transcriptional regulator [Microbacterium excoecariae]NHI16534.1 GntR family transcriptional regulator [Microbacterium excoecariae]